MFYVSDDDTVIGIEDIKSASEFISQKVKKRIESLSEIILNIHKDDSGKEL